MNPRLRRLIASFAVAALTLPLQPWAPAYRVAAQVPHTQSRDTTPGPGSAPGEKPKCACPVIPAIATNDKPDPRKGYAELSFGDLEWAFSDLESQYGGDWDKAMLALAHQIDPSGRMKIWDKPAPAPANPNARVTPGALSDYLIKGPKEPETSMSRGNLPRPMPPQAARALPRPIAPPPINMPRLGGPGGFRGGPANPGGIQQPAPSRAVPPAASAPAPAPPPPMPALPPPNRDPHQVGPLTLYGFMSDALYTLARINKYGEPKFGLRKAVLRVARFLADDLGAMPVEYQPDADVSRIRFASTEARMVLNNALMPLFRVDPGVTKGLHSTAQDLWIVKNKSKYPDASVEGDLAVDEYDLANAALDVISSVDEHGTQEGLLKVMPRGGPERAAGGDPFSLRSAYMYEFLVGDLVRLAAKRQVFGGSAVAGSPEDAVACKAFSALVALGDRDDAAVLRAHVFGNGAPGPLLMQWIDASSATCPTCFQAARAARILEGLHTAEEGVKLADFLYPAIIGYSIGNPAALDGNVGSGMPTPVPPFGQIRTHNDITAVATMHDFLAYSHGAGMDAFSNKLKERFAAIRRSADNAHAEAERKRAQAAAIPPIILTLPGGATSVMPRTGEISFLQGLAAQLDQYATNARTYSDAFAEGKPDIDPKVMDQCQPPGTPPRVVLIAKGVINDLIVDKFYQDVPMAVAVVFEEPYDKDTYPVKLKAGGGEMDLTARRNDKNPREYITETFTLKSGRPAGAAK